MYAQIADLEQLVSEHEFTQLAQSNNAILETALERASREIDSYIATRYNVPIALPSLELIDYCVVIARYWLYSRNGQAEKDSIATQDYLRVLARLQDVQNSKKDLVGVALKETHPADGLIDMTSSPRLFGR